MKNNIHRLRAEIYKIHSIGSFFKRLAPAFVVILCAGVFCIQEMLDLRGERREVRDEINLNSQTSNLKSQILLSISSR